MIITLTDDYYASVDSHLLGYMGEKESRVIKAENLECEGAEFYKIRFTYDDKVQYEADITDGEYTVQGALLREVGLVDMQILAVKSDGTEYEYVKKSNIFKGEIRESDGSIAPIPTYDESVAALDRLVEYDSESKANAEAAEESAKKASNSATAAASAEAGAGHYAKDAGSKSVAAAESAKIAKEAQDVVIPAKDTAVKSATDAEESARRASLAATNAMAFNDAVQQAASQVSEWKTDIDGKYDTIVMSAAEVSTDTQKAIVASVSAENSAESASKSESVVKSAEKTVTTARDEVTRTASEVDSNRLKAQQAASNAQGSANAAISAKDTAVSAAERAEDAAETAERCIESIPEDYDSLVGKVNSVYADFVKVSDTQPTESDNKIWVNPNGDEVEFYTAEESDKRFVRSVNNVKPDVNGNVNVSGGGGSVTVDSELSLTSENPVQNKVVTGAIEEINSDLESFKIQFPINSQPTYTKGKWIATKSSPVNPNSLTTAADYKCAVITCREGDKFLLTGTGGATPRLWCFCKSDNTIITVANSGATANELILTAPAETSYAVFNIGIADSQYVIIGKSLLDRLAADEATLVSMSNNVTNLANSFITPEMFGAIGDATADDTTALQTAINYAISTKRAIICANRYKITQPIVIANATALDMKLNYLQYQGSDSAIKFSSRYCNIDITYIISNGGNGFCIQSDYEVIQNKIHLGRIYASSGNCIQINFVSKSIVGNTISFTNLVANQNKACINYDVDTYRTTSYYNVGNNNYVGGRLEQGLWGVYGARNEDSYITCQFEGVKNVMYCKDVQASMRIVSSRYAEVCEAKATFDITQPSRPRLSNTGYFLKYETSNEVDQTDGALKSYSIAAPNGTLYPANFDITKVPLKMTMPSGTVEVISKNDPRAVIRINVQLLDRFTNLLANEFLIFGRHILIDKPASNKVKTITSADTGYAGDYSVTDNDSEFYIYSKFIVDDTNCVYTLPPSYDLCAFSTFKIVQNNGNKAVFKDWRGTIIFDGNTYGDGEYELAATITEGYDHDYYDNRNQTWLVTKLS